MKSKKGKKKKEIGKVLKMIVDDILKYRKKDAKGNFAFSGMNAMIASDKILAVLFSTVKLSNDIPLAEKSRIVVLAFRSAVKIPNLTVKALCGEIHKEANGYLGATKSPYFLLSSLSIKHTAKLTPRYIGSTHITFHSQAGKAFDRSPFRDQISSLGRSKFEDQYTWVYVKVPARTPIEAEALSIYTLDLLRGCWNLHFNYKTFWRYSWNELKPINEIRRGRVHTIHEPNGKCAGKSFWYEPNFTVKRKVEHYNKEWEKVRRTEEWIRRNLKNNSDNNRLWLEDSIVRYCRALDENMPENAFLKLWSLLERLTGSFKGTYDITIKRTAFRYDDRQRAEMELQYLREQRNRTVHHTIPLMRDDNIPEGIFETNVNLLKYYVEKQLLFLIRNLRTFDSLKEYWNYLDLPADENLLKNNVLLAEKQILLSERALKMFEGK